MMRVAVEIIAMKNGGLYRISSRNLRLGVFREDTNGFIGIREKFGNRYLDTEYLRTESSGTATPKEFLEDCPILPLNEGQVEGETYKSNKVLFQWLDEKEKQYAD